MYDKSRFLKDMYIYGIYIYVYIYMGTTQKNCMYMCMCDTKPIRCVSSVLKTLQHIATHCNTQKWGALDSTSFAAAVTKHYIILHHIATHYNTL